MGAGSNAGAVSRQVLSDKLPPLNKQAPGYCAALCVVCTQCLNLAGLETRSGVTSGSVRLASLRQSLRLRGTLSISLGESKMSLETLDIFLTPWGGYKGNVGEDLGQS